MVNQSPPSGEAPNFQMATADNYPGAYRQLQQDLNACLDIVKGIPHYGPTGGFASATSVVDQLQEAVSHPTTGLAANFQQYIDTLITPVVDVVDKAFKHFPAQDNIPV